MSITLTLENHADPAQGGRKTPGRQTVRALLTVIWLVSYTTTLAQTEPPFWGTIFIDPDIITEADPTSYLKVEDAGQGQREMYDRREGWVYQEAFLFDASFSDGPKVEIQVNPEFGSVVAARAEAQRFAPVIGRLPKCLRNDLETVWIHKGNNPFGGGNNNLLIHTGQAEEYMASGILEETLVHEASHTSLDGDHAYATKWQAAQAADDEFISTYARDNPYREDVAESFLLYYALKHRPDRISESLAKTISETIPNRIAYFDNQALDLAMGDVPGSAETTSNSIDQAPSDTTTNDVFIVGETSEEIGDGETFEDTGDELDLVGDGETFEDTEDDSFVGVPVVDDECVDQSETMDDDAWNLATDHGDGWREFDWFGYFYESEQGWLYHYELGWLYQFGECTDSIWFWKHGIGWIWTNADLYPYLYRPNVCCWMFLNGGSENRWDIYDFGGSRWMQLGE